MQPALPALFCLRTVSAETCVGKILMATVRSRRVSRARYTSPIPPVPRSVTISDSLPKTNAARGVLPERHSLLLQFRLSDSSVRSYCPVPLSDTLCCELATALELSVTVSVAVREPFLVGLNFTLIAQFEPAARVTPQVVVRLKSPAFVPPIAILLIVNCAVPVFESVTV